MANVIPLELDLSNPSAPVLKRLPAANDVDPSRLPAATGAEQGAVVLSGATPAAVGSAGAAGSSSAPSRSDHVHAHGNQAGGSLHANATTGAAGFMAAADKAALDGVPAAIAAAVSAEAAARDAADDVLDAAIAALGAANLASSGLEGVPDGELGLFRDRTGSTLNLRSIAAQTGLEASSIGGSVRIGRRPKLFAPRARAIAEQYQRIQHGGRRTAGAVGDAGASGPNFLPADLLATHGATDHLYPWAVFTSHDTHGLPHQYHAGLRGNYAPTSVLKGYEHGESVAAGDAVAGRRFEFELAGMAENVGWLDAFWDFALEINPTAGNYAGPNLMRLTGPELDRVWAGQLRWRCKIVLTVTGPDSCEAAGEWTLVSASGATSREWKRSAALAGAHNWLAQDAKLQLRWRVDRDLANRVNSYTGENQGVRQGANVLRLHVDSYSYNPIGFREG